MDASVIVRGYTIQSGNSVISRDLTPAKIKETWEKMVSGRVARVFDEESRLTEQSYSREECSSIFRAAFLLFAGYVDAATTFAQNCGGGGSAPDQNWGRDKNEDDILWARRCFRKAREMVTTPVIRWGRRR